MDRQHTRQQIIEIADRLFYQRGFDHTSFADIASEAGISRGNFYYHFKTKDEILEAVIDRRMEATRRMLDTWESHAPDPMARIRSFIGILIANRTKIMQFGCPVGTLCSELAKLDHPAQGNAGKLFGLFRDWLAQQFAALGRADAADALALHLLGRSQGVAALATAFRDDAFVDREVADMMRWAEAQVQGR